MSNSVTIDLREVRLMMKALGDFQTAIPQLVMRIGLLVKSSIIERVQKRGMGIDKALSKYSIASIAKRKAGGRQVGFKDLTYTGRMMNSITVMGDRNKAVVAFGSKSEENKALGHEARGDRFFGIGNTEAVVINKEIEKAWSKL